MNSSELIQAKKIVEMLPRFAIMIVTLVKNIEVPPHSVSICFDFKMAIFDMMLTGDSNKSIKIAHHFRKYRSDWKIRKKTAAATVAEWRQRQQIEM